MSDGNTSNELRRTLSRNLRIFRQDRGLTQHELAAAARVSQRIVSNIESQEKNADLNTITVLAEALGVSALDLLTPLTGECPAHR